MKLKNILLLFALTSITGANAIAQQTGFTIKGNISGLPEAAVVELSPSATHKNEKPVASAKLSGGQFILKGKTPGPRLYALTVAGSYGAIQLMVDNREIKVSASSSVQKRGETPVYNFSNVKVSGSPLHDQYLRRMAYRSGLDSAYEAYHRNNQQVTDAMGKARNAKDSLAIDSISKSAAWAKMNKDEKEFFDNVERKIKGGILADKNTWWGPFMMMTQLSYFSEKEKPLFESFSKEAKESYYGKLVKAELYPPTFEGKPAPAFTLVNDKGEKNTLQNFTAGKKYVLLDFWASWCAPCRKSIPGLKELYSKYADKGFQIVSISTDKNEQDWIKAAHEEQLPWLSFLDRQSVADAFNVKAIPSLFLIDSSGKVVKAFTGADGVKEKVDSLF